MGYSQLLERITLNPKVMTGKPVIRGPRLTVQYILGLLAHGANIEEILKEYEGLTREDILTCLLFATESLERFSVYEQSRGADDDSILQRAYAENRILITNDKDFGELIYRGKKLHRGVILPRLEDERADSKRSKSLSIHPTLNINNILYHNTS